MQASAILIVSLPDRLRWLPAAIAAMMVIAWLAAASWLATDGLLIAPLTLPTAALAAVALRVVQTNLSALTERRRLRTQFAQYVFDGVLRPPQVHTTRCPTATWESP